MSEQITVDKNIPIPPKCKTDTVWSELFRAMHIGDSFVVKNEKEASRATSSAYNHNMRASVRKQPDGTYRVWRKS